MKNAMKTFQPAQLGYFRLLGTLVGLSMGLTSLAPAALAAEKLVVTYGLLSATLSIEDMETLVETQEAPGSLKFYLNLASLDPSVLRNALTMEFGASSRFMQGMLNSESGEQILTQMSEVIHLPPTPSSIHLLKSSDQLEEQPTDTENVEALRAALVKSAEDRQVTVLEVLQNYPSERVYVRAGKLLEFVKTLEEEEQSE